MITTRLQYLMAVKHVLNINLEQLWHAHIDCFLFGWCIRDASMHAQL